MSCKCMICGIGMKEGATLFRQNPKGEIGIWACWEHRRGPVDAELDEIIAIVERASNPPAGEPKP